MTNRLRTDVRLVKCPRCAEILPEPEQVPLYTCGGCGTILQAKYYKQDNRATGLGLLQQGGVQSNDVVDVPDNGESGDSSQRSSSSCEQSIDQNGWMNVNDVEDCKSEQIEAPKSSATEQSTDQNGWRDQNSVDNCKSEQIESPNSAHHTSSSEKSDFPDNQGNGVIENKTNQFDSIDLENKESEQFTVENAVLEEKESSKFVPENTVLENTELQHPAVNGAVENMDDQHEQSCDTAFDNQKQVREASENGTVNDGRDHKTLGGDTGNEHLGKDHDDLAECIGEKLKSLNLSEARLSTATDLRAAGELDSSDVSRGPQHERNSVDEHAETCGQKIDNSDDCAVYGPEQVSLTNTHEEVGSSVKVVPRSLTKGSPAYDGSVSSLDGNDDQALKQHDHNPDETLPGNEVSEGHEWSNIPSSGPYRSSRNNQTHARNFSQVMLDEKLKSSMLEEEELEENLNAIPGKHRIRQSRERFPPRAPFYRSSELAYETGSSSSYIHDEVSSHQMCHHPYRYDRRRFPEASVMENEFLPMYYNSYETSGEFYHRSGPYGYIDRMRRAESWSQSGSLPLPPMPYLGEVCYGRYQMQDPYMHNHRPDALRWSTQLPPRVCRQGQCAGPSREIRWDPYHSYPTSPPSFMESESYRWAHDINSLYDDQRYKDQVMRRLYRREKEKQQMVKRHLLPMAGGAPFVTCYFCFRALQLPQDFILSRRKTHHRLRCGNCSKILEFSLENESCLAPRMPNATASAGAEANTGGNVDSRESFLEDSRTSRSREIIEGSRSQSQSHDAEGSSVPETRQLKVTWQLPARSNSPLHRLMGYSSPHDLLNGDEIEDLDS